MPHPSYPVHAVITGDLIASSSLPDSRMDAAMSALHHAAQTWVADDLHFTRFRGDGWQILIPRPGCALRIAFLLSAALAAADTDLSTRLAIGFGSVTRRPLGDLSAATGTAFIRSGRALDAMPRGQTWAVSGGTGLPAWVAASVPLAAWQAALWTKGQATVVADYLDPVHLTQEDRAARVGLTRQAWKSRFAGSGIAAWQPTLDLWENWNGAGVGDD